MTPSSAPATAPRPAALALLALLSGACALVYQIAWARELRLVFGASTHASAAVLAIFMGGLGLGAAVIGRRADRHPRPLRLYGLLEAGVAAGALASPLLFALVRAAYVGTGGIAALGEAPAIALRLALSAAALGAPTFLMGGTLPALARAVETAADPGRRRVGLLYGVNTLGAVCGVGAATFMLLERLGTRWTILAAAALNAAVAAAALLLSRAPGPEGAAAAEAAADPLPGGEAAPGAGRLSRPLLAGAAALAGFAFFLMEMIWYRMLAPLLGGTTYTFGLILAVALAGIGIGGLLFTAVGGRLRPGGGALAATFALEALGLAAAYGLGDRLALLAYWLRPAGGGDLAGLVAGWTAVSAIVVLPASVVAGFQFPLLIAVRGRGEREVGGDTGGVYGWNTAGSILGSLVGGFGLLPLLGAPACWRLTVALLAAAALALAAHALRRGERRALLALAAAAAVAAGALLPADGPTAAWRHSAIGVGGATIADRRPNSVRAWRNEKRFAVEWERDGRESSVALDRSAGLAFIVNGRSDGNARGDAGTQVMSPLVGAALHPAPRRALVVGLGTGSSAGWLAAVDTVERVDVAELEPAILEVARRCAPVNRGALANPKVRVHAGDGRELLLTSRERYDVVVSEPSNPYRAGVAALFTREYFRAVAARLAPGGIFLQWLQAYQVRPETVSLVAATLASVFADVEVWQTTPGDLLFVCGAAPRSDDPARLAARVGTEPFRSALLSAWGVTGIEGFLTGFVADDRFARGALRAAAGRTPLNTDDRSAVEFGFARPVAGGGFSLETFRREMRHLGADRLRFPPEAADRARVGTLRALSYAWQGDRWDGAVSSVPGRVYDAHLAGRGAGVLQPWREGRWTPVQPFERVMLAEALADAGDRRALELLPAVAEHWPAAAAIVEARFLLRAGDPARALEAFARGMEGFRADPWNPMPVMRRSLDLARELARVSADAAVAVFDRLEPAWSVRILDEDRIDALIDVSTRADRQRGVRALAQMEPNVFWSEPLLRYRVACYEATGNPRLARARRELAEYLAAAPRG